MVDEFSASHVLPNTYLKYQKAFRKNYKLSPDVWLLFSLPHFYDIAVIWTDFLFETESFKSGSDCMFSALFSSRCISASQ